MNSRADAIRAASQPLWEELALKPGQTFSLKSARFAKNGITYEMVVTPEGYVVHQGLGCEGEPFNGPRGCYHSKKSERYVMTQAVTPYEARQTAVVEFSREDIETIKQTIAKGTTDSELRLFVATCQRTALDPFARQIYCIKRRTYNTQTKGYDEVMTIQVGIDGLRLIAERTGNYAGMEGPQWSADGQTWLDAWYLEGNPKFARVAVYRKDLERPFVAVARWDAYAQKNNDGRLLGMWAKMGAEQLAKCAEALGFRRAFPNQMTGLAAAIDQDYDPSVEHEELRRSEPQNAIEGVVIDAEDEHEVPQETPVSASAGAGIEPGTTSPAASPDEAGESSADAAAAAPDAAPLNGVAGSTPAASLPDTTTQAQMASIQEWQDDIAQRHGKSIGPVATWFAKAFPYTKKSSELTQVDAASYIRLLRHVAASKDGAVPADGGEPEHAYVMPDESPDPVCEVCGLVYIDPEQAALPAI